MCLTIFMSYEDKSNKRTEQMKTDMEKKERYSEIC